MGSLRCKYREQKCSEQALSDPIKSKRHQDLYPQRKREVKSEFKSQDEQPRASYNEFKQLFSKIRSTRKNIRSVAQKCINQKYLQIAQRLDKRSHKSGHTTSKQLKM